MPSALLTLLAFQLLGEVMRGTFRLPVPGPVIGMFLLAAALGLRARLRPEGAVPVALRSASSMLIGHMGLLFVPAGVGAIAEFGLIEREWLPIAAALLGSTLLSLAVTGLVMHRTLGRAPGSDAVALRAGDGLGAVS